MKKRLSLLVLAAWILSSALSAPRAAIGDFQNAAVEPSGLGGHGRVSAPSSWGVSINFVGNTEVFLRVRTESLGGPWRLHRNGVSIGLFGQGTDIIIENNGLPQGMTYQYELKDESCPNCSQLDPPGPVTTGQVRGIIHRDMTWTGEWQLYDNVSLDPGVALTIQDATVVSAQPLWPFSVGGGEDTHITLDNVIWKAGHINVDVIDSVINSTFQRPEGEGHQYIGKNRAQLAGEECRPFPERLDGHPHSIPQQ